jgi:hypothetical protein
MSRISSYRYFNRHEKEEFDELKDKSKILHTISRTRLRTKNRKLVSRCIAYNMHKYVKMIIVRWCLPNLNNPIYKFLICIHI